MYKCYLVIFSVLVSLNIYALDNDFKGLKFNVQDNICDNPVKDNEILSAYCEDSSEDQNSNEVVFIFDKNKNSQNSLENDEDQSVDEKYLSGLYHPTLDLSLDNIDLSEVMDESIEYDEYNENEITEAKVYALKKYESKRQRRAGKVKKLLLESYYLSYAELNKMH